MYRKQQVAFTLVELVIVIVLLGILAVVAAPRFLDIGRDARISALEGLYGAIQSGSRLAFSKCLSDSTCDVDEEAAPGNGLNNSILVQGEFITLAYGYPRHTPGGIARMVNATDISEGGEFHITTYVSDGRNGLRFRPNEDYIENQCEIRYSQALFSGDTPLIESQLDEC
ncbi:pilus assembly FimT family protein [Glaciecola sp. 2405UD65-10]|uniref:pilus assembly FimT family protein n=1 Tax=Glaciecola sp. 2405UD65-10 TaxID=3397244 RepID=UPI003B5AE602